MTFPHKSAFLALAVLAGAPALAQEASLPGGAGSLREKHGDWIVSCTISTQPEGKKIKLCSLAQEQFSRETRQRTLAIELRPESRGLKGPLVLPFGLALEKGASYQLDAGHAGTPQRFRTCLPVGCIIEVSFDTQRHIMIRMNVSFRSTIIGVRDGHEIGRLNAETDAAAIEAFMASIVGPQM